MAVNGASSEASAVGRVAAVNPNGIKFEGAEQWSNFSKYATDLAVPSRGDIVSVTFDRQGFIRSITPADGQTPTNSQTRPRGAASADRDRTISRLAILKAAAEFGASRPQLKSGDILTIAASWERWVNRDEQTLLEVDDAF